jgi:hypothetical protein
MNRALPKLPKGGARTQSPMKARSVSPAPGKSDGSGSIQNNRSKSPAPPLQSPEGRMKTPRKNKFVSPSGKSAYATPDDAV